jgi:hypothetical protein
MLHFGNIVHRLKNPRKKLFAWKMVYSKKIRGVHCDQNEGERDKERITKWSAKGKLDVDR